MKNIKKVKCQQIRQSPEQKPSDFWVCFATCSQETSYLLHFSASFFFLKLREKLPACFSLKHIVKINWFLFLLGLFSLLKFNKALIQQSWMSPQTIVQPSVEAEHLESDFQNCDFSSCFLCTHWSLLIHLGTPVKMDFPFYTCSKTVSKRKPATQLGFSAPSGNWTNESREDEKVVRERCKGDERIFCVMKREMI